MNSSYHQFNNQPNVQSNDQFNEQSNDQFNEPSNDQFNVPFNNPSNGNARPEFLNEIQNCIKKNPPFKIEFESILNRRNQAEVQKCEGHYEVHDLTHTWTSNKMNKNCLRYKNILFLDQKEQHCAISLLR